MIHQHKEKIAHDRRDLEHVADTADDRAFASHRNRRGNQRVLQLDRFLEGALEPAQLLDAASGQMGL